MKIKADKNVLAAVDHFEDAGVYRLTDDIAIVQSVDLITPVVDDPYIFGQIAAANALSDIYAMGAKPVTALNIIGVPICDFGDEVLIKIHKGGLKKLEEAGCSLIGGHTLDDLELKYGLCVTGTLHPDKVYYNNKAAIGHEMIITKPIGNGIITTAGKAGMAEEGVMQKSIDSMLALNKDAGEIMKKYDVSACTDVTGFGLLGHMYEVAHSSDVSVMVDHDSVPVLSGAYEYASMGLIPAGSHSNEQFLKDHISAQNSLGETWLSILCDPQTSGGLMIFVNKEHSKKLLKDLKDNGIVDAQLIGNVIQKSDKSIIVS